MSLRSALGLDTRAERYAYAHDESAGYTARAPDSRPLGADDLRLLLGRLRHGHRREGWPRRRRARQSGSSGERGKLCPKGLSEHDTIHADTRARHPLLRRERALERVVGTTRIGTMASRFRDVQRQHGRGRRRRHQHRPTRHRGVLHARQAGAARLRHEQLRRQHHALHGHRRLRLQALVRQRRPSRRLRGSGARRRRPADRRQHRRQPSDSLPAPRSQSARAR